jgi:hypothetical protein
MADMNTNNHGGASAACLLVKAYENGEANGGSIDWSDVDEAHEVALREVEAERRARKEQGGRETLADWLIGNVLTEAQLNVTPPGHTRALRYFTPSVETTPCQNGGSEDLSRGNKMRAEPESGEDGELGGLGLTLSSSVVESVAHVAAQVAAAAPGDCRDLGAIGAFMRDWVASEAELSALNLKEINEPSYGAADDARRAEIEGRFAASLKKLLGKASVTGLRVDFPGEPRGPAIHVYMNPCLSNSFQGGLVVLL